jgi:broad specificity phosphatase PhoE
MEHYGFVLRHGETRKNDIHQPRGLSPVPLSRKGVLVMEHVALLLKGKGITSIRASRLKRTEQSAEIVGRELGIKPEFTKKLDTMDIGDFEKLDENEADKKVLEYIVHKPSTPMPNGQSIYGWQVQVWPELIYFFLLITHGKHPLIVTHGRVSQLIDALIKGNCDHLDKTTFESLHYVQKPGEAFLVTEEAGKFSFKKFA